MTKLRIVALAMCLSFAIHAQGQSASSGFPKGDLSSAKNHTGNIWLNELNVGDSTFDPSVAMATYDAGAKLDWHMHPGGQVLLITRIRPIREPDRLSATKAFLMTAKPEAIPNCL